ncbi:MAG TPA: hypothetical protein VLU23_15805 [Pseudolabrys sp.]|jgi:hypothetical protein|nr:hypothetical protein [Pseudolabrys sp.]
MIQIVTQPSTQPGTQPVARSLWGEIFYRSSLMLAGFFVLLALGNLAYKASEGDPWIPVFPLVVALVIWLSGRSLRYMLNARID